jgi:hypothetical protein
VSISADSFAAAIQTATQAAQDRALPPVDQWNPPFCGDIDMRIAKDGTWHYMGTPIGRPRLARLFSTVLKREGDAYFLVTPAEKVGIIVDDAPFLAIDFDCVGTGRDQVLTFHTSMGDSTVADQTHPLRLGLRDDGNAAPYVEVRSGLDALIDRKSYFRLIDLACEEMIDGSMQLGVWSSGVFFSTGFSDT